MFEASAFFKEYGSLGIVVFAIWLSHRSLAVTVADLAKRLSELEHLLMQRGKDE